MAETRLLGFFIFNTMVVISKCFGAELIFVGRVRIDTVYFGLLGEKVELHLHLIRINIAKG